MATQLFSFDSFIDPCWDPVFKSIFTQNTALSAKARQGLLSAILEQNLKEVTITANEPPPTRPGDRQIRYDVNCVFDTGEMANVEMTLYPNIYEPFKLEYYSGRLFVNQEIRGKDVSYKDLRRSYQISLLAHRKLFKDDSFDHLFVYYDPRRNISLGGRTAIITLELEKLALTAEKPVEEMSRKERWGCFFRYFTDKTNRRLIEDIINQEEAIAMAVEVIEGFSANQIAVFHEISKEKYELDMRAHRDEAREEGRILGWAEGQAKGLEEGRTEGRRETAKNLKEMGLSVDQIAAATGLAPDLIKAL
ncbi:MAG: Rpn family recombination-promoting nuclease/putative transposase [Treponema sp.]|jgi:predicted transposase/invertase (TIGR01784 family)|nr:Rpn family recombination-promoting nuclease/putative transposase [Treponema sp.]